MEIKIKELDSKEEMLSVFPLLSQMYRNLTIDKFSSAIDEMIMRNGYKMVAAFHGKKMVGVSGYWVSYMFYCGRYLQCCNFFVDDASRRKGIGGKILNYLEEKARKEKCDCFVLDSYTENKKSHSLLFREGFYVRGFHFMKDL